MSWSKISMTGREAPSVARTKTCNVYESQVANFPSYSFRQSPIEIYLPFLAQFRERVGNLIVCFTLKLVEVFRNINSCEE